MLKHGNKRFALVGQLWCLVWLMVVKLVRVSYEEKSDGFTLPSFDVKISLEMSLVRQMNQVFMNHLVFSI